ncbi:hypothetical protein Ancab_035110 [Ancistrocladus abbreviatus]
MVFMVAPAEPEPYFEGGNIILTGCGRRGEPFALVPSPLRKKWKPIEAFWKCEAIHPRIFSGEGSDEVDDVESSDEGSFSQSSDSDDSEDISQSDPHIDDELVEDYSEGIGGNDEILDARWLKKMDTGFPNDRDSDDDDDNTNFSSGDGEFLEKLGGSDLQETSRECDNRKP